MSSTVLNLKCSLSLLSKSSTRAVAAGLKKFMFEGSELKLVLTCNVFITRTQVTLDVLSCQIT